VWATVNIMRGLAGVFLLVALIFLLFSIIRLRRSRSAAYYATRRLDLQSGLRRFAVSAGFGIAALALGVGSLFIPVDDETLMRESQRVYKNLVAQIFLPTPAPAPTLMPTMTASAIPPTATATVQPSATPTIAPTVAPIPPATATYIALTSPITPTATSIVTRVPTATVALSATAAVTGTPAEAQTVQPKQLRLRLMEIASGIDIAAVKPLNAGSEFSRTVHSIYIFFEFRDVPKASLIQHTWYREGANVHFEREVWSLGGKGTGYIGWSPPEGFAPGLYEVRVLIDNEQQFVANFMIK
jgi:hypothetical protein